MLDQLLQYDRELFLFLNNLGSESWDGFWMIYTTKFYWTPLYAILLYLIYKNENKRSFLVILAITFLMVLFTDQITNLFKHGLERYRPCHEASLQNVMRLVKPSCGGKFGFFSGHASNSMAVAVFVGLLLRQKYQYLIFMLLPWAAAMGYSRIYIGVHYPLDVLCGMTFGALSGYSFYRLLKYLVNRFTES